MKKAFVHIGAQKTASTFIQRNLILHKQQLADEQELGLVTRADVLPTRFGEEIYKVSQGEHAESDVTDAARESLYALFPDECPNILMTNEGLICRLEVRDFYQRAGSAIRYLRTALPDFDLHVILYVRNQTDYLESTYMQLVHLGRRLKFARFMRRAERVDFSWLRVAESIDEALPPDRLHLRTYEQIKNIGDVEFYRDFLSLCGINDVKSFDIDKAYAKGRKANRSYGQLGMKIAQRVNPMLNPREKKLLRRFLQENFSTATHPRARLLDEEQRAAIFKKYQASNRQLFERYDLGTDGESLGYF